MTSQLTLKGGQNDVWIFKAASDLTPKNGSVVMANGGNACNVYWQVGTAVDLLNTAFVGNVLAGTAITFTGEGPPTGTASSLVGRALAQSNVTMTGANITNNCGATPPPPPSCDKHHKHDKHDCDEDDGDHDDDGDHGDDDKDRGDKHPFGGSDDK